MNKEELKQKVDHWLTLFDEDYDFQYRWHTHDNFVELIANKTACLRDKDDRLWN